ncbi:hypothetical protein O4H49_03725 [Kiloniella laminariae]|uniref:DUF3298 domain-containing protein n=1 Tax=Kiloniella laminariae TaxID=454162 RepID=A0ABT4LFK1_9PROT|nr:hypothetical protein [Kiloniella laminariae]MCZ4279873.1 hypothetical protein [Kiloniella laminariae]
MMGIFLKFFLYLIGIIVSIPVIFFLYLTWSQRPYHAPTFYSRVTVDMKVDGHAVHMERIITCKTVPMGGNDLSRLFKRVSSQYVSYPRAFGSYLPDGAAVMMWTPYECDREEYQDDRGETKIRAKQLHPDYVPRIGWTPDTSTMETLELYIDRDSFKSDTARVTDLKFHVELVDDGMAEKEMTEPDDFQWFSGNIYTDGDWKSYREVGFNAYYALVLKEKQWRGYNAIVDAELDSYTHPQMVERRPELGGQQPRHLLSGLFAQQGPEGYGITYGYRADGVLYSDLAGGFPKTGHGITSNPENRIEHLFPEGQALRVKRSGLWDRFVMHRQGPWRINGKRVTDNPNLLDNAIPSMEITFLYGDTVISPKSGYLPDRKLHPSLYLYDPETKEIFLIEVAAFSVYPAVEHPLFQQAATRGVQK